MLVAVSTGQTLAVTLILISCGFCRCAAAADAVALPPVRFATVVSLETRELATVTGSRLDHIAVLACTAGECAPIPFQYDARDADGHWLLDNRAAPPADAALGADGALLFMAADAGDRLPQMQLPDATAVEIEIADPLSGARRWTYVVASVAPAARNPRRYVSYDPAGDVLHGTRVSLGFAHGLPNYLALSDAPGANLLDRLKVRATATFLFGLLRFARSEDDLRAEFLGWHAGPIRVLRAQRQWVRIGWGIRSPTFLSYATFYRDYAELPVGLRLNFPPTYFFGGIEVRALLDLRDLRGWSVRVPGGGEPIAIGGGMGRRKAWLNELTADWFVLLGPQVSLLERIALSESLAGVRVRLSYSEGDRPQPPESVPGGWPVIGYRLDRWEHVAAGQHQLSSISYALPPAMDAQEFIQASRTPLTVRVQPLGQNRR